MTWAEALHDELTGSAALTALVGTRIYHQQIESTQARPFVVFEQIAAEYLHHQPQGSGLAGFDVQITSVGTSDDNARDVSEVIRATLADQHKILGGGLGSHFDVTIVLQSETESLIVPQDAGELGLPAVVQVYTIWYDVSVTG